MDIHQSPEYANHLRSLGWIVERNRNTNYFVRKLPFIGSVLKIQRPKEINFEEIEKLGKKYRSFQIILEPNLMTDVVPGVSIPIKYHNLLLSQSFKLSKSSYLPTKTLRIDLTQSKEQIFAGFKKDTRSALSNVLRSREVLIKKITSLSGLKTFRKAWRQSVPFSRYVPPLKNLISLYESFPQSRSLFLASHNKFNKIIGGAVFTKNHEKDITYYWYAFTSKEGRASLSQYHLLYYGILWAKKTGSKIFDFEGIYDPRFPNKSWLGFTHFKKSFGGYKVSFPGCYTKSDYGSRRFMPFTLSKSWSKE